LSPASTKFRAVIQARYGSRRFPGKVLKEFRGKKVLAHVLEAAATASGKENVVLATSDQSQDDAVAAFAANGGWAVHRGSLEDVWSRFRDIAMASDATWIIRICADSPLMSPFLIQTMIQLVRPAVDLVTNIFPRTFPRGQSVEIIHGRMFREERFFPKTNEDREHVTSHLYRIPGLRIVNHKNPSGDHSHEMWSVEKPGDIERLEKKWHG
jgi:spore coat polysaccharide biosynthesis protein SpsF (cytidylyltransferase family)